MLGHFIFGTWQWEPAAQQPHAATFWDTVLAFLSKNQPLARWAYTIVTAELWDDQSVREARRLVGRRLEEMKGKTGEELEAELWKIAGNNEERKAVDMVIYRSNLVGLLWEEAFLSQSARQRLLGYIYKTAIASWHSLEPYIQLVRKVREEAPGSITYAIPFERLVRAAEKRLGNGPRPTFAKL